jgi:cell division transport system permease protein
MEPTSGNYYKRRKKSFFLSTIISIAMVLLMVGLLGIIIVQARKLSRYVKENIALTIIVAETANEIETIQLQKKLETMPFVKFSEYIDKETAAKKLKSEMGEDFVTFLGYNPLLSSIELHLKAEYTNKENIAKIQELIQQNNIVKEVYYQENLVDIVNQNIQTISLIIVTFAGILLVIAIGLINNTIRIAMYSQRFIIRSMQLVGATTKFIRTPFVFTGIIHGILGALIAIIMLISLLIVAKEKFPDLIIFEDLIEFAVVFVAVLGTGVFISWFSTHFAVNKYFKTKTNDLS